jgi:hypothetical protein
MRIFAFTVGRNEENRYLYSFLTNVAAWADVHFFFDDRSDDDTAAMAWEAGAVVSVRHERAVSFEQDEGLFRGTAWQIFEETCHPETGDWVFVIDCDEMLVGLTGSVRDALGLVLGATNQEAVDIKIPEVFGYDDDGTPLVRTDRLWGTVHGPRLFMYRPGGRFNSAKVGAWGQPHYVMYTPRSYTDVLYLMHFGYAFEGDAVVKFNRYINQPGHAADHVISIMSFDKHLVRWDYALPGTMVYRGDRTNIPVPVEPKEIVVTTVSPVPLLIEATPEARRRNRVPWWNGP